MKVINVDPTIIEKVEGKYHYGDTYENDDGVYEFVYFHARDGGDAAVKGYLALYCVSGTENVPTPYAVTVDYNTATKVLTTANMGAGEFCSAPTTTGWGVWIKKIGPSDNASLTDGSVDVGDTIVAYGANGTIAGIAFGASHTSRPLGIALKADASTTAIAAGGVLWQIPCKQ
jgi:hypothetical protein